MTKLAFAFASALALTSVAACKKKAAEGGGAGNAMAKMAELKDKMCACKDPDCAKRVSEEMTAWSQSQQKTNAPLSEADQKRASELGTQMGECMQKAMNVGAGSAAPTPAEGSAAAPEGSAGVATAPTDKTAGLPKECDDYKAAIDKLGTCEKMPKAARETLIKAYADASAGWKDLPAPAKDKLAQSCKAGAEAVLSTAKAQCGWQ